MSTTQHRISDYLQYELYHLLGAYGVAEKRLANLERRLEQEDQSLPSATSSNKLHEVTRISRLYNESLARYRHAANVDVRHPIPEKLPLTLDARFKFESDGEDDVIGARRNPWAAPEKWAWIPRFYDTAIFALQESAPIDRSDAELLESLSENLVCRRYLSSGNEASDEERRARRLKRYKKRRTQALKALPGQIAGSVVSVDAEPSTEFLHRIISDNLGTAGAGDDSLPLFVLRAQAEAHLSMHGVEAWKSLRLGQRAKLAAGEDAWLRQELERSIVLSTFAYCVSRSAPWIFAEDSAECAKVFEQCPDAWRNVVPTRCMWIASQVSLLALHRRAYASSLLGNPADAYNDYHKLQRLIRDSRRRVQSAPIHVDGALEFLAGLDAQAHHHIGELYRSQHAHKPAGQHFRAASHRLERLAKNEEMREVLTNSRWHVQLQVSHGKAKYEMGKVKESLCWHLRGWKAFLELLAADTQTRANTEAIDTAIKWLKDVLYEPELLKPDVQRHLRPVIDQMRRISVDDRLAVLASDILLRLGHVLFVLNLGLDGLAEGSTGERGGDGPEGGQSTKAEEKRETAERRRAERRIKQSLAFPCLEKAAECDNRNTLIGADLLKARFRFRSWFKGKLPPAYDELLKPAELDEIKHQWPGGGSDYERLARVTEYLILRAQLHRDVPRAPSDAPAESEEALERENVAIASEMLLNFFMHTDSINVRKSQAHHFLMKAAQTKELPDATLPAIEFVCMRRYSSAFPLLPRPSAFRALGGGYFVRLHADIGQDGSRPMPFGIVVDPGVDFVENLYRTGYSVSDIDMIVITHDHVDHLGSLDPLLSLLYTQKEVKKDERGPDEGKAWPTIFASESVRNRYAEVKLVQGDKFRDLSELLPGNTPNHPGLPEGFELIAMSTAAADGTGHVDLSLKPSYGICLRAADGPSLAITGDSPPPPKPGTTHYADWYAQWSVALEADAIVAHLSTIPLTELRQMAALDASVQPVPDSTRRELRLAAEKVKAAAKAARSDKPGEFDAHVEAIATEAGEVIQQAKRRDLTDDHVRKLAGKMQARIKDLTDDLEPRKSEIDGSSALRSLTESAISLAVALDALPHYSDQLATIRDRLQEPGGLRAQLEFGLWLRSADEKMTARLVSLVENWEPPRYHAYLAGTLEWARAYRRGREHESSGVFIIGELSEELGTVRGNLAGRLNETVFRGGDDEDKHFRAVTADIGLHVLLSPRSVAAPNASVLCTTCNLDMDRVPAERYHAAHEMREVCVKGENEGIFYNCEEHNPSTQEEPVFLEQLERFDIFGR